MGLPRKRSLPPVATVAVLFVKKITSEAEVASKVRLFASV